MGEGCIDFELFAEGLRDYAGWYDAEVLGDERLAAMPLPALLERLAESFKASALST